MSTDIPRFSWERKIGQTVNTFGIGRAMFRRVTARRVCLEARSPTLFSRGSKRRVIWPESLAHHLLTRIWPLFFEVAPVFRKRARNAGSSRPAARRAVPRSTFATRTTSTTAECACLSKGFSLKRQHASRNLKTSLVGSSFAGGRCNYLRSNRVYSSAYGCCHACAVLWSVDPD